MVASLGTIAIAAGDAQAADGTIDIRGAVANTTCSINSISSGGLANVSVTLPTVPASTLSAPGEVFGASNMGDIQMQLGGCAGLAIKAVARFENGPTVDQASGYLQNEYLGNGARRMSGCAC